MTVKKNPNPRHVSVRLRPVIVKEIDAVADFLAPLGSEPNRSAALRAVIVAGLSVFKERWRQHKANSPKEIQDRAAESAEAEGGRRCLPARSTDPED
jgi:hypothetical protein